MKTAKRFVFALLFIAVISIMFAFNVNASAEIIKSGECGEFGDNLLWTLDSDGRLEISGSGGMEEYNMFYSSLWGENSDVIKEVVINAGVTNISKRAFDYCTSLRKITIPETVVDIGDYAFFGCVALEKIEWNAIEVSDFSMFSDVFRNCGINGNGIEIIFGDSVKTIPEYLFYASSVGAASNVVSIEIGISVSQIADNAFKNCATITKILVSENNPYFISEDNVLYSKSKTAILMYPGGKTEEYFIIPDNVRRIECNAFENNSYLQKLTISENIAYIGDCAFENCIGLTEIYWNAKNVDRFSYPYVFDNAGNKDFGLTVIFGESVNSLPSYALCNSNVSKICFNNNIQTIASYAFYNCRNLTTVCLSKTIKYIELGAFENCTALAEINMPISLEKIGYEAFRNTGSIKKLTVENPDCVLWSNYLILKYDTVIYCHTGGAVEEFAERYGYSFVATHMQDILTAVNPTCTATGLTEGKKCSVCGEMLVAQTEIPAIGHNYIATAKAPTCTEGGFVVYTCTNCGDSYSPDEEIPALGHKEEIVEGKSATCTATGLTEGKKCSVCGEILVAQTEIPATGHNYTVTAKAPTCTESGFVVYTCTNCGDSYSPDEEIPALGHTAGEWEVVSVAQVGIDGKEQKKCTVCGYVVAERIIPALSDVIYVVGDVNGDGKITSADARLILRLAAQIDKIEAYTLPLAAFDMNVDGKITSADARKALRISAKLE